MNALLLEDYGVLRYVQVPRPVPACDEVLIRVKACAICGSDIHGMQGGSGRRVPPIIMGHEASGVIEQLGGKSNVWRPGDRVTFDSTEFCGVCHECKRGRTNLCQNRRIVGVSCADYKKDGAMAEYLTVKARALYRIPDGVTFEEACLTGPLAVATHAVRISPLREGDTALVIGSGTIGLMTVLAAKARGAGTVILSGRREPRLRLAEKLGADAAFASDFPDTIHLLQQRTGGRGADVVFDAVGSEASIQTAFQAVCNGGAIVMIGNNQPAVPFPLQECIVRQISLLGSYSSAGEYGACLEMIQSRKVRLEELTGHCFPLSQGAEVFQRLLNREDSLIKAILHP